MLLKLLIFEVESCHFFIDSFTVKFNDRHFEEIFFLDSLSFSLNLNHLIDDIIDCFVLCCFEEVNMVFLIFVGYADGEIIFILVVIDIDLFFLSCLLS